ncbi:MAG TPA: hypothetical protein PK325_11395 [Cyclobacteriaceae bacterium]|nr:hypothetical protein [Cyclobacteriaceae bacterium]HMV08579.1 hypothetical protein [Cyclobacteriaceae bacterium]HMV91120.1 hypothetical protein [Cyclobacteriaceae bacterium]HMX00212.1 hypothetical protein [Cyclobacteriaceae bacterium]HMX49789.1 hypothetical protein [Cyclobacteriaceae bacterium]
MKTQKKALKKSSQKAAKKAIRKPAAKKAARKTAAKKLSRTAKPKANEEQEFPGYPKYPASEDIMNTDKRLEGNLDDEVLTGQSVDMSRAKDETETFDDKEMPEGPEDDLKPAKKSQYDVTKEDLEALGPEDLSMDMGDDEQLKHRNRPVDFTGKDLDIPDSELDDESEEVGAEDEENNSYSIGGDNHEDLEEPRT